MSDSTTIARPYAKAIFEHAMAASKLADWSVLLLQLAEAVLTPEASDFIANPTTTDEQKIDVLIAAMGSKGKDNEPLHNLISLLTANKRLTILPDIKVLYEQYKAEQEKTLEVNVASFSELTKPQQDKLIETLSERLHRKVSLSITIDPTLLGGAMIRAGDLVIDGSIRGKLNKLNTVLAV